jgi:hypothetical protein
MLEMAGLVHESLSYFYGKPEATKLWTYHTLEGRPESFTGDDDLLECSIIEEKWIKDIVGIVCDKYQEWHDVVTDNGSSKGAVIAVFESYYLPKEEGVARQARDADVQGMIDAGEFVGGGKGVPDCLYRALFREFRKRMWPYTRGLAEGTLLVLCAGGR